MLSERGDQIDRVVSLELGTNDYIAKPLGPRELVARIRALTHATLEDICRFPPSRDLAARMMSEARAVGEKLGVEFKVSLDRRIAGAESVGAHKTSMLQDVEHCRALELQALVGSVVELARITDTPTPTIDAIYAATALLTKTLTDRGGRLEVQPASR
jgi:2-dehydropantoate 2-reductase